MTGLHENGERDKRSAGAETRDPEIEQWEHFRLEDLTPHELRQVVQKVNVEIGTQIGLAEKVVAECYQNYPTAENGDLSSVSDPNQVMDDVLRLNTDLAQVTQDRAWAMLPLEHLVRDLISDVSNAIETETSPELVELNEKLKALQMTGINAQIEGLAEAIELAEPKLDQAVHKKITDALCVDDSGPHLHFEESPYNDRYEPIEAELETLMPDFAVVNAERMKDRKETLAHAKEVLKRFLDSSDTFEDDATVDPEKTGQTATALERALEHSDPCAEDLQRELRLFVHHAIEQQHFFAQKAKLAQTTEPVLASTGAQMKMWADYHLKRVIIANPPPQERSHERIEGGEEAIAARMDEYRSAAKLYAERTAIAVEDLDPFLIIVERALAIPEATSQASAQRPPSSEESLLTRLLNQALTAHHGYGCKAVNPLDDRSRDLNHPMSITIGQQDDGIFLGLAEGKTRSALFSRALFRKPFDDRYVIRQAMVMTYPIIRKTEYSPGKDSYDDHPWKINDIFAWQLQLSNEEGVSEPACSSLAQLLKADFPKYFTDGTGGTGAFHSNIADTQGTFTQATGAAAMRQGDGMVLGETTLQRRKPWVPEVWELYGEQRFGPKISPTGLAIVNAKVEVMNPDGSQAGMLNVEIDAITTILPVEIVKDYKKRAIAVGRPQR